MKPALPKGFRWLRVGHNRPVGYKYFLKGKWATGFPVLVGDRITRGDMDTNGPYIAPIRKGRKRK